MPKENVRNLVLNLRQVRKQEALEQALLVPWRQLDATVGEYVQWHSFVLWVRTVSESAGELPTVLRSELRERCPGFVEGCGADQQRPLWKSLEDWIAAQRFGNARTAGWFGAVMYYAYKDLRIEQGWSLWERIKVAWRQEPPSRWPTFEEWKDQIASTHAFPREGTEKSRAVAAMANVDEERLRTAVADVLDRRALSLWVDCISKPQQPLDAAVWTELRDRCPSLTAILSPESPWHAPLLSRLIRAGESDWRSVSRREGWYSALRYCVAHHPRYQRFVHYRQRCHDEWLTVRPISLPSFPVWLASADAYCVERV
jgi:hypothetical protein